MATTLNLTTTYAGEKAGDYVAAALLSARTIEGGGVTVRPNIKYKQVLKKVSMSGLIADGSCDYDPTGTITISENILEPKEFQVNYTLCKQDFRQDWDAATMGFSAFDVLPPSFSEFIIAQTISEVATENDRILWHGDDSNPGEYNGYITIATADADVLDVASTASGGVTNSNVLDELGKVVDTIPTAIYGKEDLYIFCANNVWRSYKRALGGFQSGGEGAAGYMNQGNNQDFAALQFDGVKLFPVDTMEDSYMLAGQASNLHFGTSLLADHNEVKLLDMADLDGSQNVRFVMRYTAGAQYVYGSEIVLYTPSA
jgi:hypothetical protein